MAYGVLRIPPSGPPVTNTNGGQAIPGDGFPLRMLEQSDLSSSGNLSDSFADITLDGGGTLELAFSAPDPNRRYRAEMAVEVASLGAGADQLELRMRADYDGGGFSTITPNQPFVLPDSARVYAWLHLPLTLGSGLLAAMPAGTQLVTFRPQARTGTAARGTFTPSLIHFQIQETT